MDVCSPVRGQQRQRRCCIDRHDLDGHHGSWKPLAGGRCIDDQATIAGQATIGPRFQVTRNACAAWIWMAFAAFVLLAANTASADWWQLHSYQDLENLPTLSWLDLPGPERYEPIFGFEFGGITLQRSEDTTFPMVFTDGLAQTIATSEIVSPDSATDFRYSLQLQNLCSHIPGLDTELTYYDVGGEVGYSIVDTTGFTTTNVVPVFFNAIPASAEAVETFSFRSNVQSVEWNLGYRPFAGLRLIGGLRWFDVDENFNRVAAVSNLGFFSASNNNLFGFQLGLEGTIWTNGIFRVFGGVKWADLENEVSGNSVTANADITFDHERDTSLIDLEFGVSAAISKHAALQIAYQGLILNDAAAILDQVNGLDVFGTNDQVPAYSEISWHGIHYGICFMW